MSTSPTAPSQSPFEEVRDTEVVRDVFQVAFRTQVPITFWIKDRTIQFEAKLAVANKERLYIDLPPSVNLDDWDRAVKNMGGQAEFTLFGTVQVQKSIFFLKLLIADRTDRTLKLYHPNTIFKLQRRQNFRIRLPTVRPLQARILHNGAPSHLSYRMLDISVGGIGIFAFPDHADKFASGTELPELQFRVNDYDFKLKGIVRYSGPGKDESGKAMLKVGIEFKEISSVEEKVLAKFVMQESRKLFSTL